MFLSGEIAISVVLVVVGVVVFVFSLEALSKCGRETR